MFYACFNESIDYIMRFSIDYKRSCGKFSYDYGEILIF